MIDIVFSDTYMARFRCRRRRPGFDCRRLNNELITICRSRRTAGVAGARSKMWMFVFSMVSPISSTVIWSSEKRESKRDPMSELYFVGVYYPAPSATLAALPGGYVLSPDDLDYIRRRMAGVPITFNHRGVMDALPQLLESAPKDTTAAASAAFKAASDPTHRPLGQVTEAWQGADGAQWCAFTLDYDRSSALLYLINAGFLRGLSLTHVQHSPPEPIEVSLCGSPARPGCGITTTLRSAFELARYKGLTTQGILQSLTTTMSAQMDVSADSAPTSTQPTQIDSILAIVNKLAPGDRDALSQHLVQMNDVVVASKAELTAKTAEADKLQQEVKDLHKSHETDNAIMKDTIEQLISTMTEIDPKTAGMLSCRETLIKDMNNPHVPLSTKRAMDQMLVCASRVMLGQKMSNTDAEEKRARFNGAPKLVEAASAPAEAAVVEPKIEQKSPEERLRNALASHFERMG